MHNILFYNKFIICLYILEHYVLIIRRSKFYYTASGIITPEAGRPVRSLREDWLSLLSTCTRYEYTLHIISFFTMQKTI